MPPIQKLLAAVEVLVLTFWVGSLWTTGLMVAPVLFNMLDDRSLAGSIAGRLFETTAFVSIASGCVILGISLARQRTRALREPLVWVVIAMLGVALLGQLGVQPVVAQLRQQVFPQSVTESALREQFATWHAIAEMVYLLQCVLGAALVLLYRRAFR